jgi:hypothetical protein
VIATDTATIASTPKEMPMIRLVFFGGSRLISKMTSRAVMASEEWQRTTGS